MKRSLVALIIFTGLLTMLSPGTTRAETLIENGGFESKSADAGPENWQVNQTRDTKADVSLDTATVHSGTYAYRIDIAPPGGRVMIYPKENASRKPQPGQTYRLSLWINARNLDYNQFFVAPAVRFNFQPTRISPVPTIDLMAYMKGVDGWKELTLEATAPDDAEDFNLDIILTQGTVWIDDISLTPLSNP